MKAVWRKWRIYAEIDKKEEELRRRQMVRTASEKNLGIILLSVLWGEKPTGGGSSIHSESVVLTNHLWKCRIAFSMQLFSRKIYGKKL